MLDPLSVSIIPCSSYFIVSLPSYPHLLFCLPLAVSEFCNANSATSTSLTACISQSVAHSKCSLQQSLNWKAALCSLCSIHSSLALSRCLSQRDIHGLYHPDYWPAAIWIGLAKRRIAQEIDGWVEDEVMVITLPTFSLLWFFQWLYSAMGTDPVRTSHCHSSSSL